MKGVLDRGVNSGRFCKVLMTLDFATAHPLRSWSRSSTMRPSSGRPIVAAGIFSHKPVASLPIMRTLRCWDGSSTAKPSL